LGGRATLDPLEYPSSYFPGFVKELITLCCSNNEFPRCVEANGSSLCNLSFLSAGVPTSARFVCLLAVSTALKSARLFSSAIQKFDGWYGMRFRRLKPTGNIVVDLEFTKVYGKL
jgi:hypothetical protein